MKFDPTLAAMLAVAGLTAGCQTMDVGGMVGAGSKAIQAFNLSDQEVIALSDQLILLHVRGIESSIFIDCFLFKAVQKYIKPLKDRQKSGGFYIFFKNITGKQSVPEQ